MTTNEVMRSIEKKRAEEAHLWEGLRMWAAAKAEGYEPAQIRCFGIIAPENVSRAIKRGQPLHVARLHTGEDVSLDEALAELGKGVGDD